MSAPDESQRLSRGNGPLWGMHPVSLYLTEQAQMGYKGKSWRVRATETNTNIEEIV